MKLVDVSYDLIISPCGVHCSYVTEIFFVNFYCVSIFL